MLLNRVLQIAVFCLMTLSTQAICRAEIRAKEVEYQAGSVKSKGTLFWDDEQKGRRPGVLVVHEWWGLDDYAKSRARKLAEEGYVAFACDMYGEGKTTPHPKDAGAMATNVRSNQEEWLARANAAVDVLKHDEHVDAEKLVAIGYCFGGSTVLQLAIQGSDLDAVVSYHGALPKIAPADLAKVKAKVFVYHGADDAFIPKEAVEQFQQAFKEANASLTFVAFPGVRHSFTVPDAGKHGIEGMKYDENADKSSWQATLDLLNKVSR